MRIPEHFRQEPRFRLQPDRSSMRPTPNEFPARRGSTQVTGGLDELTIATRRRAMTIAASVPETRAVLSRVDRGALVAVCFREPREIGGPDTGRLDAARLDADVPAL